MNKEFTNCELNRLTVGVVKKIRKKQDEILSPYGLTHYHATYIENLEHFGELSLTDLTMLTNTDKANTTRVIHDLVERDIVLRQGSERRICVRLSELGQKIAKEFKSKVKDFMDKVMEKFDNSELGKLKELLNRLFEGLKIAVGG